MINKAIKFFEEEIVRLRKAPEINGCEMTPEWLEMLQIYNTAVEALRLRTAPKTNFERIKAMSVDEMAEAIYRNDDLDVVIPYCKCKGECDRMTPEEAIAVLEDRQICRECVHSLNNSEEFECGCDECDNAFGMAYDALQKQIPKKPKLLSYGLLIDLGWKHECPNCKCAVGKNEYLEFAYGEYLEPYEDYCPQCGQAIDWSDTK